MSDERQGKPSSSGIERLALCPKSFQLEQQCPDQPTPDADRGTRIAEWLASDRKTPLSDPGEQEDAEKIAAVEEWAISMWLTSNGLNAYNIERERRLWLRDSEGNEVCSGKPDVDIVAGDRGLVLDHKSGWQDTSGANENRQLRTNAVILADAKKLKHVTVAIIQPNKTEHPPFTPYDEEALRLSRRQLLRDIEAAQEPDAPLIPGQKQCQFCRAALVCLARKQQVEQLAVTTIHETGLTVSNQDLVGLLDKCGPAAKMIASIKAEAFRRAEKDPEAWRELGYEIVTPKGRSEISDLPAVSEKLNALGVPWPDISARCKMSKGAVKDLLRPVAKAQGLTLKDAEWSVLQGNTALKPGKPKLARIGAGDDEEEE